MDFEVCTVCESEQKVGYNFCTSCGSRNQVAQAKIQSSLDTKNENIRFLASYAFVIIGALVINLFIEERFITVVSVSVVFAAIDVIFAFKKPSVWDLVTKPIDLKPLLWIIPCFIFSGVVVFWCINNLNEMLFEDYLFFDYAFLDTKNPLLYSIIFIAVFPAIFEELAFRGFVFNGIKQISGTKSAMWGSSFLFALVHFSILSLFWLIPFALILSKIRIRYSSIVYGMVAHFTHNATVTIIDYYHLL